MNQEDYGVQKWFVVFRDSAYIPLLQKILKNPFHHVWAFTYDAETHTWLRVESTHRNLVVRPVPSQQVPYMLVEANKCIVVQYEAVPVKSMWKCRFFLDCSSMMAHLLGIDIFFHTPYRLFCELRKRGGIVTFPEGYSEENRYG